MDLELIQKAASNLHLVDIHLASHSVQIDENFDAMREIGGVTAKTSFGPRMGLIETASDDQETKRWSVNFGANTRIFENHVADLSTNEDKEPEIIATLDVEFKVIYLISENASIDQEALDQYAKHNIVHLVWPHVREWIQNICARCRIPILTLPSKDPMKGGTEPKRGSRALSADK